MPQVSYLGRENCLAGAGLQVELRHLDLGAALGGCLLVHDARLHVLGEIRHFVTGRFHETSPANPHLAQLFLCENPATRAKRSDETNPSDRLYLFQ